LKTKKGCWATSFCAETLQKWMETTLQTAKYHFGNEFFKKDAEKLRKDRIKRWEMKAERR
jgi:hypothetical protein